MENKFKIGKNEIMIGIGVLVIFVVGIALTMCNKKADFEGVQDTPLPTASGVVRSTVTGEEVPIEYEIFESLTSDKYMNKEISAVDNNGGTLTLGVANTGAAGLILSPRYTLSEPGYKIGYYISSYHDSNFHYSAKEPVSIENLPDSSNVVIDWTYDRLYPADYIDDNSYGIMWTAEYDDAAFNKEEFKIEVIDMSSHNLIGVFNAVIRREDNKYTLSELYCTDVSVIPADKFEEVWKLNKYLTETDGFNAQETRQKLIDATLTEIASGKYIKVDEPYALDTTTVELTYITNHLNFLNDNHGATYKGQVQYPIWAVNINSASPSIGHYTFYFTKETLSCLGCDFIYLNTYDELKQYNLTIQ